MTEGNDVSAETQGAQAPSAEVPASKPKGLAVAGLVLGICGLVFSPPCFLIVLGPLAAIVGIILSAVALSKAKAGTGGGAGLAKGGLICATAGIILWAFIMAFGISTAKKEGASFSETMKKVREEVEKSAPAEPGD